MIWLGMRLIIVRVTEMKMIYCWHLAKCAGTILPFWAVFYWFCDVLDQFKLFWDVLYLKINKVVYCLNNVWLVADWLVFSQSATTIMRHKWNTHLYTHIHSVIRHIHNTEKQHLGLLLRLTGYNERNINNV